jgi:hypothetical protein
VQVLGSRHEPAHHRIRGDLSRNPQVQRRARRGSAPCYERIAGLRLWTAGLDEADCGRRALYSVELRTTAEYVQTQS